MNKQQHTALITGASEGLGRHLALECARRKMNLVLAALPNSNLEKLSCYIRCNYGVQVWSFEKDLSLHTSCSEMYDAVKEQGIKISVLINNAGMGGTFFFDEGSIDYYQKLIQLNVVTPTLLTRLFLNDLKQNTPSYILNVSSLAGIFHLPRKSVYGGTKAFVLAFSKSLCCELKGQSVSVSVLCPGGINTTWQLMLQHRTTGSWVSQQSVLYPAQVAAIAITKMLEGKEVIVPGLWNRCFLTGNRLFPKPLKALLTNYAMRKARAMPTLIPTIKTTLQEIAVA